MSNHFVDPEYYLVSYWPGVTPSDNITTIRTESKLLKSFNFRIEHNLDK